MRVEDQRATLDIPQAAKRLGISVGAAYRAALKGSLPTIKVGGRRLVPIAKLERLLGEQSDRPEPRDAA